MLLPEEKLILQWLSQYEALPKELVIRLLNHKPRLTAEKIIRGLQKQNRISYLNGGYYIGSDPRAKPDQRMIQALWVLAQFGDRVDPMSHIPAAFPSQVFFIKEGIGYEILVLREGEHHLSMLLQPQEDRKYIIVLPDISLGRKLHLPDVPCLFAVLSYGRTDIPEVKFYKQESNQNGKQ